MRRRTDTEPDRADTASDATINPDSRIIRDPYPLSGVVFEVTSAGNTPVEGVEVLLRAVRSTRWSQRWYTAADGVYSFDGSGGVATGRIELLLAKRGYILPNQPDLSGPSGNSWMGRVSVTVRRYALRHPNHPEVTPAVWAGTVDVIVINPGDLENRLTGD